MFIEKLSDVRREKLLLNEFFFEAAFMLNQSASVKVETQSKSFYASFNQIIRLWPRFLLNFVIVEESQWSRIVNLAIFSQEPNQHKDSPDTFFCCLARKSKLPSGSFQ